MVQQMRRLGGFQPAKATAQASIAQMLNCVTGLALPNNDAGQTLGQYLPQGAAAAWSMSGASFVAAVSAAKKAEDIKKILDIKDDAAAAAFAALASGVKKVAAWDIDEKEPDAVRVMMQPAAGAEKEALQRVWEHWGFFGESEQQILQTLPEDRLNSFRTW